MNRNCLIYWLAPVIFGALLLVPGLSHAQDDLDVTMRMVTDDQELDDSLVQQLELPESADSSPGTDGFDDMSMDSDDFTEEIREDMLDIEDTLAAESRESRDALGVELPGELVTEEPELDLPGVEAPELGLPGTDDTDLNLDPDLNLDTDLNLLNNDPVNVEDTELQ